MESPSILFEADPEISVVTLNRPASYNAIRRVELERLDEIILSLEMARPRIVILTATPPGFCSGIDLEGKQGSNIRVCALTCDADARRLAADYGVSLRRLSPQSTALPRGSVAS